jgi:hypothetical protein
MDSSSLEHLLCKTFCGAISVRTVPSGLAVSTLFQDNSGDRITFYVTSTPDGIRLEDDGDYLATLMARDIPITDGVRGQLLTNILSEAALDWDRDTLEIKSEAFDPSEIGRRSLEFLSASIRVRDLELLTREIIKSTFREDFIHELNNRSNGLIEIEENGIVDRDSSEFPADLILRPKLDTAKPAAVYLVNSNDRLNEALLAWQDRQMNRRDDYTVIGVIEDADMRGLSRKKFQRAQNRQLPMPIFRGEEESAISFVMKNIGVPLRASIRT